MRAEENAPFAPGAYLWRMQVAPTVRFTMHSRFAAIVASVMVLGYAEAQPRCLSYEPEVVTLRGSVIYRTFTDASDRAERVALLLLDEPICVESKPGDDLNVSEGDQVVVHLNADPSRFGFERELSGKRISATGALFHAHTAHHHAALVLTVRELSVEKPNAAMRTDAATRRR